MGSGLNKCITSLENMQLFKPDPRGEVLVVNKNIVSIAGIILLVFVLETQGIEGGVKEGDEAQLPIDGLTVMTMVGDRDRGEDYVVTTAWRFTEKGRVRHTMEYSEKRKNYSNKDDILYKSAVRYTAPPNIQSKSFLIWNYRDRERAFWYFVLGMSAAQRTTNLELIRSLAETDFNLTEYYDINLGEEKHQLLRSEACEETTCYVVQSIPIKRDLPYGKRIIWIDQEKLIPLKIEYYDKKEALWKLLTITWKNRDGVWFWKKAVVENVQNDNKTFIAIEDVKLNTGLKDRDFTRGVLQQQNF